MHFPFEADTVLYCNLNCVKNDGLATAKTAIFLLSVKFNYVHSRDSLLKTPSLFVIFLHNFHCTVFFFFRFTLFDIRFFFCAATVLSAQRNSNGNTTISPFCMRSHDVDKLEPIYVLHLTCFNALK